MADEHHDNPIFGRKVFFLNPPYSVRKVVLGNLQEMEYEIYVIDDYKDAKNILRHYKDSICFINVDEQLTPEAWFNFVTSFEEDEILKTIFLGIITERLRKADKDQFMLKANIPAGLIPLNGRLDDITETFNGILEINGAKGRRQYVRAQCAKDPNAVLFYTVGGKMYQFKLLDISSVGTAAILPPQFKDLLQPNSVMRDITISLGTKQLVLSAAVFAIKENEKFLTLVLLFMKGTLSSTKSVIREYIFKTLSNDMLNSITGEMQDSNNYDYKPREVKKNDDAFLLDVDPSELEEEHASSPLKNTQATTGNNTSVPPKYDGSEKDLTMTSLF
jgi:hypothetical protein